MPRRMTGPQLRTGYGFHIASIVTESHQAQDKDRPVERNLESPGHSVHETPQSRDMYTAIREHEVHHDMLTIRTPVRVVPTSPLFRRDRYTKLRAVGLH